MALPVVAIVGRPNVGKSSLLNTLAGKRISIVDPTPEINSPARNPPLDPLSAAATTPIPPPKLSISPKTKRVPIVDLAADASAWSG